MPAGLIADDLTGALDAGAGFARQGLRAGLLFSSRSRLALDVLLVNTETRDASEAAAARRAHEAATRLRQAGIARVYKKIDSVLRGHPGVELAAVLDVYGGRALVAPAFPAQGRTTVHGVQLLHGQPVPPFAGRLADALGPAAARCDVLDAATDDDLARIAREGAQRPEYRVWCGTAGLAAHVPAAWGLAPHGRRMARRRPLAMRLCVVAGTPHPSTEAQQRALLAAGWDVVRLDARRLGEAAWEDAVAGQLRDRLAPAGSRVVLSFNAGLDENDLRLMRADPAVTPERVTALLRRVAPALLTHPQTGLILTGGETALHVCRALGARSIEVTGEALPGIPLGVLRLPRRGIPVATKSGGFGQPDALLHTAAALLAS